MAMARGSDMMLMLGGAGGAGAGGGELDDYDDDLDMMGGEDTEGDDEDLEDAYPPEFAVFAESALGTAEPDRIAALYQAVRALTEEY